MSQLRGVHRYQLRQPVPEAVRITPQRLRREWADFMGNVPWELMVTLTLDPNRHPRDGQALITAEGTWWFSQVARVSRRPIGWLLAPERHDSGRWHAHGLAVGLGKPELLPGLADIWRSRNGRIDIRYPEVTDGRKLMRYLAKAEGRIGGIVLSDTMVRYRHGRVTPQPTPEGLAEAGDCSLDASHDAETSEPWARRG